MDTEEVVYIYNRTLLCNQKEWNIAIHNNVDRTRVYYAKQNKSVRKDKYPMISLICGTYETKQMNTGNGWKNKIREREANHKRLLNTENKLKVAGGGGWGVGINGWWA